ncbi:MAG TPA: M20/M25/M40 family metallo-hydrolase [Gemmatimonadaceae bacterium]
MRRLSRLAAATAALAFAAPAFAQTLPTNDRVLRRIWDLGMEQSRTWDLAQVLMDSIGPRLTGSPGHRAGNEWLARTYASWGIPARQEQYGTWKSWRRGVSHVDLVTPRVRSLEGTMLAYSPGTAGRPVTAPVVILPEVQDSAAFVRWLPAVKGKYVLVSMPQPTCRPDSAWAQWATPESFATMRAQRDTATQRWSARVAATGYGLALGTGTLGKRLEEAGAAGVIASRWSAGWGVNKVFETRNEKTPAIDLSCEDYGLVFRLAEKGQNPTLRITAESQMLGEQPVFNTVAEMKGTQKPGEYVVLSAHFDSWDAGSGATDNGTGTVVMMEAMRILKQVYPNPKRTILVGHWGGEEQGLNGSRAFSEDHPEVVKGLQALFNQDNGTGRVVNISSAGLVGAAGHWGNWLARLPQEISRHFTISFPGAPNAGGSDNASFLCSGAPAFGLGSINFDYFTYTWHTNRDTFDKISFDDVRNNATLVAMLAYMASEDPEVMPREQRVMALDRQGRPQSWPACGKALRKSSEYTR